MCWARGETVRWSEPANADGATRKTRASQVMFVASAQARSTRINNTHIAWPSLDDRAANRRPEFSSVSFKFASEQVERVSRSLKRLRSEHPSRLWRTRNGIQIIYVFSSLLPLLINKSAEFNQAPAQAQKNEESTISRRGDMLLKQKKQDRLDFHPERCLVHLRWDQTTATSWERKTPWRLIRAPRVSIIKSIKLNVISSVANWRRIMLKQWQKETWEIIEQKQEGEFL